MSIETWAWLVYRSLSVDGDLFLILAIRIEWWRKWVNHVPNGFPFSFHPRFRLNFVDCYGILLLKFHS